MIKLEYLKDCCGCTACASICTHDAITMEPDALGFLYPKIDKLKCVECGLCEKVCAFNDNYDKSLNLVKPYAYAARHKDMTEVMKSRSGAAFVAMSDYILENSGVVYGAGYKDHFRVVHKRATSKEERDEFRGSKYVQSDLVGVFRQVKKDLNDGLTVLFSGTPCQTSGLCSFVGKRLRKNLILVDIICHGVPSPYLWRDYLVYQEKKYGEKINAVDFRNKIKYGWDDHRETLSFGKRYRTFTIFTHFFHLDSFLRLSCHDCRFCNTTRPSDISLGDFGGLEKIDSSLNRDNKGYSLLLVNTVKGANLLDRVRERLYLHQCKLKDCLQPNLLRPTPERSFAISLRKCYIEEGFETLLSQYDNNGLKDKLRLLKWRIRKKLKSLILMKRP